MTEPLIEVVNVWKKYCRDLRTSLWYGAKDLSFELTGLDQDKSKLRPKEFWSLQDLNFQIGRGDCLGLVGRNGSGKTTILKIVNGLLKPDKGYVQVRGRVAALIALGAGFNPVLTGRENVHVNAAIYGLSRLERNQKIDEIIEFAELGDKIDSPVQSYSSGMHVRLGFSIAAALDPDVLILDEVVAVGDVGFRAKCYNRVYQILENTAVIFVSHNMTQVARIANTGQVLDSGKTVFSGDIQKAVMCYDGLFSGSSNAKWHIDNRVSVRKVIINGVHDPKTIKMRSGERFVFEVALEFFTEFDSIEVSLSLHQPNFEIISHINSKFFSTELKPIKGNGLNKIEILIPDFSVSQGKKLLTLTVRSGRTSEVLVWGSLVWELEFETDMFIPSPVYHAANFKITDCS